jgi:hypothetical protein
MSNQQSINVFAIPVLRDFLSDFPRALGALTASELFFLED